MEEQNNLLNKKKITLKEYIPFIFLSLVFFILAILFDSMNINFGAGVAILGLVASIFSIIFLQYNKEVSKK